MTFIISEDEALRDLLVGMTVSDSKNPSRSVGVWFGQPDPEIRQQSFPFVTVDLIDISEATERTMTGRVSPWYYTPENLEEGRGWDMWLPIPINLDYQVTTFARQPRHDRQILTQLMGNRLPLRFGALPVAQVIDEDDSVLMTTRRLDVLNVVKRDTTEQGKRMFMNAFTVRVSSEIPQPYDFETYYKVLEVRLQPDPTPGPSGPWPRANQHIITTSITASSGTP